MTAADRKPAPTARTAAVFLDIDGTLLGFKDRPGDVVADASLLDLLARLFEATGGALALNSGRMLADIDRIVAPLVLPAAGTHGAELRFPDRRVERAGTGALDAVRGALLAFVEAHPGAMLEEKGAAIGLHYRRAPEMGSTIAAFLGELLPRHGLEVQHGKLVADVKSPASDKGRAIAALMSHPPFAGRVPLFIGDDLTDEKGFAAVNAMDGISVKVGDGPTCAGERLGGPAEVRDYLRRLLER